MSELKDLIEKLDELTQSMVDLINVYYNKLEYTGFSGMEPYLSAEITDTVKDIPKELSKKHTSLLADDLFKIYARNNRHYNRITNVMTILENNKVDISQQGHSSSGSTLTLTYINNLTETYQNLCRLFSVYQTEAQSIELVHLILQNFPPTPVEEVNQIYLSYVDHDEGNLVIELYIHVLQKIISDNVGTPEGKEIIKYVNKSIEQLKTQVLQTDLRGIAEKNYKYNLIQRLIQMYNLVPFSMAQSLTDLVNSLNVFVQNSETTSEEATKGPKYKKADLKKVAKALSTTNAKYGFIVFNKIMDNPMEYNLWTLIDLNYINQHKLFQPIELGINQKLLDRTRTITPLSSSEEKGKEKEKEEAIEFIENEFDKDINKNYYYVIETLDGVNYRLLTLWATAQSNPAIPANWLINLNDLAKSPSRRLECYNVLLSGAFGKDGNCLHEPFITMEQYTREEIQKEENYWKMLRNRIKANILEDIQKTYNDKFIEENKTKKPEPTLDKLNKIILSDKLYQRALKHITDNISLDNVVTVNMKPDVLHQFQAELMFSYFNDLEKIQKKFKKDVEKVYQETYQVKVKDLIGEKVLFIRNKLIDIFGLILDGILENYINRKSSIYLSIQKKFDVLNKTLLI